MKLAVPRRLRSADLAVDLGTATTRVSSTRRSRMLVAPSTANGQPALRGGVVVDEAAALAVLRPLIRSARGIGLGRPRVAASVPTDASPSERDAVETVLGRAGAAKAHLAAEPLAAAVGSGIDVGSPYAQLVIDVGSGVTDCAVIRSGQVIASAARRVGCQDLERAAGEAAMEQAGVELDLGAIRELLRAFLSDRHDGADRSPGGVGRRSEPIEADPDRLAGALEPPMASILELIAGFTREVTADVGVELIESGGWVTGGGALFPRLVAAAARATGLDLRPVADPLGAVAAGNRRMIPVLARLGWA